MPTQFDHDLTALRERILKMGALAEQMIRDVVSVLVDRESSLLDRVSHSEEQMDSLQNEIDEETVRLIGVHTPVAGDLRLLLAVTRINAELERVGDQAMNIAFYAKTLLKMEAVDVVVMDIPRLGEMVEDMLCKALDAFTHKSSNEAFALIRMDDDIDKLHDQMFRKLTSQLGADARATSCILELILVARALERIADHAVSVAEDVVYMVEGKNIRHVHAHKGL